MKKNRLYYQDAYCQSFTTQVLKSVQDTEGNPYIVLEDTAFYPTGGGQPCDTGTLNDVAVHQVEEVDGEIRHFVEKPIAASEEVIGKINWTRRFDHMQQHTGQHILSAALLAEYNFSTVSFHLGNDLVSIDIDTPSISPEQLDHVEKVTNQVILENRPIELTWVTEAELTQYALHKEVSATDEIRLVIIPEYDYNGCGGIHPRSTGEVAALKILFTEKHRGKTRIHFVCGYRVMKQLQQKKAITAEASTLLNSPEEGVPASIQKLIETNHSLELALKEAHESVLTFEAKELLLTKTHGVVKAIYKERTVQELQQLAKLLVAESDDIVVLLIAENEERFQFVAARGNAINRSMKEVSTAALQMINGKGGGSDAFVQGGGEKVVSASTLLEEMEKAINTKN